MNDIEPHETYPESDPGETDSRDGAGLSEFVFGMLRDNNAEQHSIMRDEAIAARRWDAAAQEIAQITNPPDLPRPLADGSLAGLVAESLEHRRRRSDDRTEDRWDIAALALGLEVTRRSAWKAVPTRIEGAIGDSHVLVRFEQSTSPEGADRSTHYQVTLPDDVPFTDILPRFLPGLLPTQWPRSRTNREHAIALRYTIKPDFDAFVASGGVGYIKRLEDAMDGDTISVRGRKLVRQVSGRRPDGKAIFDLISMIISATDRLRPATETHR